MQQMQIQGTEIQIKEYQGKELSHSKMLMQYIRGNPVLHQGTSIRTVTGSLKILIFSG